jgi:hypothetical protein
MTRTARIAGLLYLLVVLSGPFVLLYVPGKVFVPGDPTATINSILAHENLYRASIAVGIVSEVIFVLVILTLYRLLKGVDHLLATVMVVFILIDVPLAFLGTANQVATLTLARGADFLSVFDKPQRDALVTLLINFDRQGVIVSEVFWGLWLLPLGLLVYRSRFLPRFLGVWLFINGLAYLALSATGLFSPEHAKVVRTATMPALFGEVALMLWLLIMGARVKTNLPGSQMSEEGPHGSTSR